MIDRAVFTTAIGLLAGNFGRNVDGLVSSMYFQELSPLLSTQEFEELVRRAIREEEYWPSIARLRAMVEARHVERATTALAHVRAVFAKAGGPRFLTADAYREAFDAPTRNALWADGVGGPSGLLDATSYDAQRVAQAFCDAYVADVKAAALQASQPHLRLAGGNA